MLLAFMLLLLCPVAFAAQSPHTSESGLPTDRDSLPISIFPNDFASVSIEELSSSSSKETDVNSSNISQNPQISIRKNSQIEVTQKNCSNTSQKPQIIFQKNSGIDENLNGGHQDSKNSEDSSSDDSNSEDSRLRNLLRFLIAASAVLGLILVNRFFRRAAGRNATSTAESRPGTTNTIAAATSNAPPATAFSYVMRLLDAHPELCRLCLLVALYFWPRTHWWWGVIVWLLLFQFR